MKYNIDITRSYPKMICLDNNIDLKSYFSISDLIGNSISSSISMSNIIVNIDDKEWYNPVITKNSDGIVAKALKSIENEELDILTLMLKKATLNISGIKSTYIQVKSGARDYYHSEDNEFSIGDKCIWLVGYSSDYVNSMVNIMLIFNGTVTIEFDETDILIESINYKYFIDPVSVNIFNNALDLFVETKKRWVDKNNFNGIKSSLLNFDGFISYFDDTEYGSIAIKNYTPEN
ncbi:hypothetical protein [Providencia vermicola]|uniref:hypothetical protein n=1 Tax=Providencia vermicola TaxID=333965 RepID=UPI001CED637F|nr:hypothetical protein [Providencia vermicola]